MLNSKGFVAAGLALRPRKHAFFCWNSSSQLDFLVFVGLIICVVVMENKVENKMLKKLSN